MDKVNKGEHVEKVRARRTRLCLPTLTASWPAAYKARRSLAPSNHHNTSDPPRTRCFPTEAFCLRPRTFSICLSTLHQRHYSASSLLRHLGLPNGPLPLTTTSITVIPFQPQCLKSSGNRCADPTYITFDLGAHPTRQDKFHPDGRPRSRPPASSVHGWLTKWRGTFSGNEKIRSSTLIDAVSPYPSLTSPLGGMREMREAAAMRSYQAKKKEATSSGQPPVRSGSTRKSSSSPPRQPPVRSTSTRNRPSTSGGGGGGSTPAPKPTIQRRATVTGASARPTPARQDTRATAKATVTRHNTGSTPRRSLDSRPSMSSRPTARQPVRANTGPTPKRSQSTRR